MPPSKCQYQERKGDVPYHSCVHAVAVASAGEEGKRIFTKPRSRRLQEAVRVLGRDSQSRSRRSALVIHASNADTNVPARQWSSADWKIERCDVELAHSGHCRFDTYQPKVALDRRATDTQEAVAPCGLGLDKQGWMNRLW